MICARHSVTVPHSANDNNTQKQQLESAAHRGVLRIACKHKGGKFISFICTGDNTMSSISAPQQPPKQ
jgi:hypothetical protein